jgi:hypothetical protein
VVAEFAGYACELERAFDHAERRVAEAVHDAVAQAAVVRADPHRDAAILAERHQRGEALADARNFSGVFGVRVFTDIEFFRVGEVAGIDANLVHPLGGLEGGVWLEMNIGNQRHIAASGAERVANGFKVAGILHGRRSDADDFAADLRQAECLLHASCGIHRITRQHRLDADGIFTPYGSAAGFDFPAGTATWMASENRRHFYFVCSATGAFEATISPTS